MEKEKIRARFKEYRQEIAGLKETIEEWRQAAEETSHFYEQSISRARSRAEACRRETLDRERQEESDRWYRESELKKVTSDLERAKSYGDEWGQSRAIEKLKRLE